MGLGIRGWRRVGLGICKVAPWQELDLDQPRPLDLGDTILKKKHRLSDETLKTEVLTLCGH